MLHHTCAMPSRCVYKCAVALCTSAVRKQLVTPIGSGAQVPSAVCAPAEPPRAALPRSVTLLAAPALLVVRLNGAQFVPFSLKDQQAMVDGIRQATVERGVGYGQLLTYRC